MTDIELKNISKSYDNKNYIFKNFNLKIDSGEFIGLVGPSGCGKTTLLRIISGLETINEGTILFGGKDVSTIDPKDRDISMVFQNYALYPHMTVYKNIGIHLILKKMAKKEIDIRVHKVANLFGIDNLLSRYPRELSGGQMQRVALARAMIREPEIFLMDEPLSNLDAQLRNQSRAEIMKLYLRLRKTFVYVTHDQKEAMSMSTKVVLMNDGKIMQMGKPEELYEDPQNIFTASFIGNVQMNFFDSENDFEFIKNYLDSTVDDHVTIGIRPEDVKLLVGNEWKVELVENLGSEKILTLYNPKYDVHMSVQASKKNSLQNGQSTNLDFPKDRLYYFDSITEKRIHHAN